MAHAPRRYLAGSILAAVLACLALGAGSASASTVSAYWEAISYQAAPGENNDVSIHIDWLNQSRYYVDDPGAVIAVGGSCHSIDVHHAVCDDVYGRAMAIDAGDGDDTIRADLRARIHGGAGNDTIHSTDSGFAGVWNGHATIWGEGGDDQIYGNNGEDTIDGGAGNDFVDAGWGDDTVHGSPGADDLAGSWGDDRITYASHSPAVTIDMEGDQPVSGNADDGPEGARDVIRGDFESAEGTPAQDHIVGSGWDNELRGAAGDDELFGAGGNDQLRGGDGTDVMHGGPGDDMEYGEGGNDYFSAEDDGRDDFTGGDGRDMVSYRDWGGVGGPGVTANLNGAADDGPAGAGDTIRADVENLEGTVNGDALTGDDNANTIYGLDGPDQIAGQGGDDALWGNRGNDQVDAGAGNDSANGNEDTDLVSGDDGDDVLDPGEGGWDVANGGAGIDTVQYWQRGDDLDLSPDDEFNDGGADEHDDIASDVERLNGGGGNDRLYGTAVDNRLDGGGGDDRLFGRGGADALIGSTGTDTADYSDRSERVVVAIDGQANDGADADHDDITEEWDDVDHSVENVVGGQGPDFLYGNGVANTLDGQGGDDRLLGEDGKDELRGSSGDDTLDGGWYADRLVGGDGTDMADYSRRSQALTVTLDGVANDGPAGEGDDIDPSTENVHGGPGDDTLTGSGVRNVLYGDGGRDRIDGAGGDDFLAGDDGSDSLTGGTGADHLSGGLGTDTASYAKRTAGQPVTIDVDGDTGDDGGAADGPAGARDSAGSDVESVVGGAGADTLIGNSDPNVLDGGGGADVVTGNDGNDTLTGGAGADVLRGSGGVDTASYAKRTAAQPVSVDADGQSGDDGGAVDGPAGARDSVGSDVESLLGGAGADTLTGNSAANRLEGRAGADVLDGGGAADRLLGGDADDQLTGGLDADRMEGGRGVDRAAYSKRTSAQPIVVSIGSGARNDGGAVDGASGARDDVAADVEDVLGGAGNDSITGSPLSNWLAGGAGNDTLHGGSGGQDRLDGGFGDDALESADFDADRDTCGAGADSVIPDGLDVVGADCETILR